MFILGLSKLFGFVIFLQLLQLNLSINSDYYEILGISKYATDREIRKGFKKKALQLHPDKNQDDDDAQAKFIKLNKAYEVLKDKDLRKKYDLYGEDALDNSRSQGRNYHSWNYYHDNFGIYDDDQQIITLNMADFEQSVIGSQDLWFINFYHPMCSHCHTLAPVWRQVALELEGIVRIGAVNCDDEYHLCSNQGIRSYPTLIAYPERLHYPGEKSKDHLIKFILENIKVNQWYQLSEDTWKSTLEKCYKTAWLIIPKPEYENMEEFLLYKKKIGSIFEELLCIGEVSCQLSKGLCKSLGILENSKFFHNTYDLLTGEGFLMHSMHPQELAKEVLNLLPDIPALSSFEYQKMKKQLIETKDPIPSLIIFTDKNDELNLEIRKLPALLPSFSLSQVKCSEMKKECDDLFILKTPAFLLFKAGGGYEIHQGRALALDIAVFAREGALATHFQILTPREFPHVLNDGSPWFVDFYAPWCPPCMKLLPEFRKASRILDIPVKFGSIDCTTHGGLCKQFNIGQYPTTILYNETVPHHYNGQHSATHLIDFVRDTIHPIVITLNEESYNEKVLNKKNNELWIVDFYANWCHHCIQMEPEYRRFGRLIAKLPNVYVAKIDCAIYHHVCQREGVSGYPTVKLFPMGYFGTSYSLKFSGRTRTAESFHQWLYTSLPSKVELLDDRTFEEMLRSNNPWLVNFYAPWCAHCHVFAPQFEDIASDLEKDQIRCGKVNCETHHCLCRGAGVNAYPTLKLYRGASVNIPRQDAGGHNIGIHDKNNVLSFIKRLIHSPLKLQFNSDSHDEL